MIPSGMMKNQKGQYLEGFLKCNRKQGVQQKQQEKVV